MTPHVARYVLRTCEGRAAYWTFVVAAHISRTNRVRPVCHGDESQEEEEYQDVTIFPRQSGPVMSPALFHFGHAFTDTK